ncbi:hypothetical protein CQ054_21710 [Ochrobactrum sp. MYb29]|nr:hypothetical protein CWE02_06105 [Brucella pituitosa]PRA79330.1 hypothetical protein CQ054_21710 [Ochrobactrum sp. MYb29]
MIATLTISTADASARSCRSPVPVTSVGETFDALVACWKPATGTAGLGMTLQFSLRSNGTLIGEPHIIYREKLNGDDRSKAFEASFLDAFHQALPVPFTKIMAGAVSGQPMVLRIRSAEN